MANKRQFKKDVAVAAANICNEMVNTFYSEENVDEKKINDAIVKVLETAREATNNANVFFDKGRKAFDNPKDYSLAKAKFFKALFNRIHGDLENGFNEALKEFNAAVPEEVKAANKD